MKKSLTILGSTGSIGVQALDIVALHPDRFSVFALTAHRNVDRLFQQCLQFQPQYVVLVDQDAVKRLSNRLQDANSKTRVLSGTQALSEVAASDEADVVLSAIVGAAALLPTMAAIDAGKRVLLANKEALVMAGELMISALKTQGAELLPIDSEHNATFQCLPGDFMSGNGRPDGVSSIVLTASGGPFRLTPLDDLATVTPSQAVAHPNWSMGAKISVDSATMMNKGLEVIEAHWLFHLPPQDIEVLVHPQSLLHAFVRYQDGSVLTHVAKPDMRVPIAHVLAWPERIASGAVPMDLLEMSRAEFYHPDKRRYPCLSLAYAALEAGGTATTVLNAANEVAVARFLSGQLSFDQIAVVVSDVLQRMPITAVDSLETVLASDQAARQCADEIINTVKPMVKTYGSLET